MRASAASRRASLDLALAALADPSRRAMVELLGRETHRASELADALDLTRPATSKHLRVLRDAGLVEERDDDEARGGDRRARAYTLTRAPLVAMRGWLDEVEGFWTAQLDAFKAHVEERAAAKRAGAARPKGRRS